MLFALSKHQINTINVMALAHSLTRLPQVLQLGRSYLSAS
ncbi:hypothetical protein EVA_17574 [gut metagenome]|uniref:Uncharacterized protein n=1 Tax=gut metagenome TaxID=749906 RepID=J9G445_9ZZZZ